MTLVSVEAPSLIMLAVDGIEQAVWEWPGADPPLLFAHATGFHGRCWDQIARRFPGHRRLAVDFRGHGRSGKPEPPYRWPAFARDLAAVAEMLEVRGAIGIGHSMGGHTVVAAAIEHPAIFAALVLIDPTIFPEARYGGPPLDASYILRRRAVFASPQEMWERYHERPPFATWDAGVLRDYCEYGLLPVDGRFVLACPPAVEASIYGHSTAADSNLYAGLGKVAAPVLVMRAGVMQRPGTFDLNASPTAPDLAGRFAEGRDLLLEGRNHYIPLESPELVAEWVGRYGGLKPAA